MPQLKNTTSTKRAARQVEPTGLTQGDRRDFYRLLAMLKRKSLSERMADA